MEENVNQTPEVQEGNGLAVAALVLGIVGLVLFWVPILNWLLAILAIIFGIIGVRKPVKKGMAKAGLILGIIDVIINVLAIVGLSLLISNFGNM